MKQIPKLFIFAFLCSCLFPARLPAVQNVGADTTITNDGSTSGVNFTADATLTADNSFAEISGAVTTAAGDGTGAIRFTSDYTLHNNVGADGAALRLLDVDTAGFISAGSATMYVNEINFSQDTRFEIDDLFGNITTDAANTGTIRSDNWGNATFNGTIGTADNPVKLIRNAGAGNGSVRFNGDVYAQSVAFEAVDNTFQIRVGDGVNVHAPITVNANNTGNLIYFGDSATQDTIGEAARRLTSVRIRGGTVTLGHDVRAVTTIVDDNGTGGTLTVTGAPTVNGNLTLSNSGTLNLGAQTLTLSGTGIYTQSAGTTLNVSLSESAAGNISASGNASIDAGSTVNVTVDGYIPDGTTFTLVDGAGGAGVAVPGTITDNSWIQGFSGRTSAGDLILTAQREVTYEMAAEESGAGAAGGALDEAVAGTGNADMIEVRNTLDGLGSMEAVAQSVETMAPDDSGAGVQGTGDVLNQMIETVSARLNYARNGLAGDMTGIATGGIFHGAGMWIQGFGSHSKQGERRGGPGYQANVFGSAIGYDKLLSPSFRLGVSGGYAGADINSKAAGSPEIDVNSFQAILYGTYDTLNRRGESGNRALYVDTMAAFSQNHYDSIRDIRLGNSIRTAQAEFSGQQYAFKVESGYTFADEQLRGFEITPFASLEYSYLYIHDYTETGAGALNLNVDSQSYHTLEQGLGLRLARPFRSEKIGRLIPSVRAAWLYDYFGDKPETTSSFTGGGPAFTTTGVEPPQHSMILGAELIFLNKGNMTITLNYDFEVKDEFRGHSYYGAVRFDF